MNLQTVFCAKISRTFRLHHDSAADIALICADCMKERRRILSKYIKNIFTFSKKSGIIFIVHSKTLYQGLEALKAYRKTEQFYN